MELQITPKDGQPIYRQIVNQIRYRIASGQLRPGARLPAVRKLAEKLVINPNTVARAYRELESLGALTSRPGAGVFVAERGSPLAWREKQRILGERIDVLLSEARQLGVSYDRLSELIEQRQSALEQIASS